MPPCADTRQGPVEGDFAPNAGRTVARFLGVPFAAPPVGVLRYRHPEPPAARGKVLKATAVGPAPLQPRVLGVGMRGAEISEEDCLTLNVFTPAVDTAERPVMVWLFGGGYVNGHGGDNLYDGSRLAAAQNVVVVTINYRLGALGFSRLGDDNCGLADQLGALRWLHDNITSFGGDPTNVTLFGESAGGMSICNLLGMPAARGLFHRAVVQSGHAENVASREQAQEATARFTQELAHAEGSAERDHILDAQRMTILALRPVHRAMPFRPHVDGVLLPTDPLAAASADVPLLIGTTAQEQRLYVRPRQKISDDDLTRYVARRLGPLTEDPGGVAEAAIRHYRARPKAPATNAAVLADIDTELRFRRPAQRYVDARGGNTWVYRFDWPSPALRGWLGACHAIDVPFVFGNIDLPGTDKFVGANARARELTGTVMARWAAFARDGNPGDDWPAYDENNRYRYLLGEVSRLASTQVDTEVQFWDEALA